MKASDIEPTSDAREPLHGEQGHRRPADERLGSQSAPADNGWDDGDAEAFGEYGSEETTDLRDAGADRNKLGSDADPTVERLRIWPPCANDEDALDAPAGADLAVSLVHIDIASLLAAAVAVATGPFGAGGACPAEANDAGITERSDRRQ